MGPVSFVDRADKLHRIGYPGRIGDTVGDLQKVENRRGKMKKKEEEAGARIFTPARGAEQFFYLRTHYSGQMLPIRTLLTNLYGISL